MQMTSTQSFVSNYVKRHKYWSCTSSACKRPLEDISPGSSATHYNVGWRVTTDPVTTIVLAQISTVQNQAMDAVMAFSQVMIKA